MKARKPKRKIRVRRLKPSSASNKPKKEPARYMVANATTLVALGKKVSTLIGLVAAGRSWRWQMRILPGHDLDKMT